MIAAHVFYHLSEATFGLIIVAVIGAIAAVQGRRARRVESKLDKVSEDQETSNGKNLGKTVHDMAQTQEIISAQIHTNTKEIVNHAETLQTHIEESRQVHEAILAKLEGDTQT
jgi:Na+/glutamate symporter